MVTNITMSPISFNDNHWLLTDCFVRKLPNASIFERAILKTLNPRNGIFMFLDQTLFFDTQRFRLIHFKMADKYIRTNYILKTEKKTEIDRKYFRSLWKEQSSAEAFKKRSSLRLRSAQPEGRFEIIGSEWCWWLEVGDNFWILVTEFRSWWNLLTVEARR